MKIEVHDTDHGQCVVVTTPNNKRVLLDCGVNHGRGWYPSEVFRGQRIDAQFLQNLDEDHVEDLVGLVNNTTIGCLISNPTVDAAALKAIKWAGMKTGVQQAHDIFRRCGTGILGQSPDLGAVNIRWFWNIYRAPHEDANNLSLAIFVEYGRFSMLFGGDLETAGWRSLLNVPGFAEALARVTVMVASHHGRDNGRCEEVFTYCKPELVIFSDGPKQYTTQETNAWYRAKATGIPELDKPQGLLGYPRRYVMTTRQDGCITLNVQSDGRYLVQGEPPANAPNVADWIADVLDRLPPTASPLSMTDSPNLSGLARFTGTPVPARSVLEDYVLATTPFRPMTSGPVVANVFGALPSLGQNDLIANALLGLPKKSRFGF